MVLAQTVTAVRLKEQLGGTTPDTVHPERTCPRVCPQWKTKRKYIESKRRACPKTRTPRTPSRPCESKNPLIRLAHRRVA